MKNKELYEEKEIIIVKKTELKKKDNTKSPLEIINYVL